MKKITDPKQLPADEIQKCKYDVVYFYNKYVKHPGKKELTKEEYENLIELSKNPLKFRRRRGDYIQQFPITEDQCFKPKKQ